MGDTRAMPPRPAIFPLEIGARIIGRAACVRTASSPAESRLPLRSVFSPEVAVVVVLLRGFNSYFRHYLCRRLGVRERYSPFRVSQISQLLVERAFSASTFGPPVASPAAVSLPAGTHLPSAASS